MTILKTYVKQPDEVKDYDIDYAQWLASMGDSLDEVTVAITCLTDPADASLTCREPPPITATSCKLWISGGTDGQRYKVTVTATTVGGRTDESELIFRVRDY